MKNVAVVVQSRSEMDLIVDGTFDKLEKDLDGIGGRMEVFCVNDNPAMDNVNELDVALVSLHRNASAKKFMSRLEIPMVYFEHDYFTSVMDVSWEGDKKPSAILSPSRIHVKNMLQRFDDCPVVPCGLPKLDIEVDGVPERDPAGVVLVQEAVMADGSYIQEHHKHVLEMNKMIKWLEDAGYNVSVRGIRDRFGDVKTYLGPDGFARAMLENTFVVGSISSVVIESVAFGCIPLIVEHASDDNIHVNRSLDDMTCIFSTSIHTGTPLRLHAGLSGVVTWIPGITKPFPGRPPVDAVIGNIDARRVNKKLHDTWFFRGARPFHEAVMEVLENEIWDDREHR